MPYVPSEKTDGKSTDRKTIDVVVENLAKEVASKITVNSSLKREYRKVFVKVAENLSKLLNNPKTSGKGFMWEFAYVVYKTGEKYGYEGAYLGEFNYAWTRFIQRVPQIKVKNGEWKEELRYWLYADTVSALMYAARHTEKLDIGVDGVFVDIKDEYKRRMNTAYEVAQIVKSGDCYDGPYYTRFVEVMDEKGRLVGHMEIMLKRDSSTLNLDILDGKIILKKKS